MQRIATATKSVDLFGAGKHGFKDGNLGLGISPTDLEALFFNNLQEELVGLVEGAGIAPSSATLTQVRQAIKRMCGGNVRTITAAGPTALTADDAGLVILDATANAVSITLPAVNAVTAVPLLFEFVRVDNVPANAITISRAGADTFVGGATSVVMTGQGAQMSVVGDATSKWALVSLSGLGAAQTMQNVKTTPGRALGTNYTNSTGRSIAVAVTCGINTIGNSAAITVGSETFGGASAYGASAASNVFAIIPNGVTYQVNATGGGTLTTWHEWR